MTSGDTLSSGWWSAASAFVGIVALVLALISSWVIVGQTTADVSEVVVLRVEQVLRPVGAGRSSATFRRGVNVVWVEDDGSESDFLLDPDASVRVEDRLLVRRSGLTGDVIVIDGPDGRLIDAPFSLGVAWLVLVTSVSAGVGSLVARWRSSGEDG